MRIETNNSLINKIINGNPIITYDTETTGLGEKSEIIQIGYVIGRFNSSYDYEINLDTKTAKIKNFIKVNNKTLISALKNEYNSLLNNENISEIERNNILNKLELLNKGITVIEKEIKFKEKIDDKTFKIDDDNVLILNKKLPLFFIKNKKYKPVFGLFGTFENFVSKEAKFGYKGFMDAKALTIHKLYNPTLLKQQFENKSSAAVLNYFNELLDILEKNYSSSETKKKKYAESLKNIRSIKRKLKDLKNERKDIVFNKLIDFLKKNGFVEYKETIPIDEVKTDKNESLVLAFKKLVNGEYEKFKNIINVGQQLIFDIEQLNKYLDENDKFTNYANVFDTMTYDMKLNGTKSKKSLDTFVKKGFEETIKEIKNDIEDLIGQTKKEITDKNLKKDIQSIKTKIKTATNIDKIKELKEYIGGIIYNYGVFNEKLLYMKIYIEEMEKLYKWEHEREHLHDALLDVRLTEEMALRYLIHQTIEKYGLEDPFEIKKIIPEEKEEDEEIEKYEDQINFLPGIKTQFSEGTYSKIENVLEKMKNEGIKGISISDSLTTNMYNDYKQAKEADIKNVFTVDVKLVEYDMPISIMFKNKKAYSNALLYIEEYKLKKENLFKILDLLDVAVAIPHELDQHIKHSKVFVKISPNIPYDYDNAKFQNKRLLWINNKYVNKEDKLSYYIYNNATSNSAMFQYDLRAIHLKKDYFANKHIPSKKELLKIFPYDKYKDIYENANIILEESEMFDPRQEHIDLFPNVKKIMKEDVKLENPQDYRKYLEKLVKKERKNQNIDSLIELKALSDVIKEYMENYNDNIIFFGKKKADEILEKEVKNKNLVFLLKNRNIDNMTEKELQVLKNNLPPKLKEEVKKKTNTYLKLFEDRIESEFNALVKFPNYKLVFTYYFLIYKIIELLKKHNIYPGPGRGSAAGSVLLYILGVTEINPTMFNLLFERFLNPDRVSLPDVDVDIAIRAIEKILSEYFKVLPEELKEELMKNLDIYEKEIIDDVVEKYTNGELKFSPIAKIGTVTLLSEKVLVFDFLRLMGLPFNKIEEARKYWDEEKDMITNFLTNPVVTENFSDDFLKIFKENSDMFKGIVGMVKNYGIHAGGVRLFNVLKDQILKEGGITSTDKNDPNNEAKMDLLGLKTLLLMYSTMEDVVSETEKLKEENVKIKEKFTDEEKKKFDEFVSFLVKQISEENNIFEPANPDEFYKNINEILVRNTYVTLPEPLKEHFEERFLNNNERQLLKKIKEKFVDENVENVFILKEGYLVQTNEEKYLLDKNLNKTDVENIKIDNKNNEITYLKNEQQIKINYKKELMNKPKNVFKLLKNMLFVKYNKIVTKRIKQLTFDDDNVYHLLNQELTASVFQVESDKLTHLLQYLHVSDFETLIAAIALYRPGPIQTGDLDKYINLNNLRLKDKFKKIIKSLTKNQKIKFNNANNLTEEDLKIIYDSEYFPRRYKKFINFYQFVNIMKTEDYYSNNKNGPFYSKIDNKIKEIQEIIKENFINDIENGIDTDSLIEKIKKITERNLEEIEIIYIEKITKEKQILATDSILEEIKKIENLISNNKYLKEITEETNGVIVYQEQIVKIVKVLAQYTKGEADAFRKAVSKSKKEEIKNFEKSFIEGAIQDKIEKLVFYKDGNKYELIRNSEYEYNLNGINLKGTKVYLKNNIIELHLEEKYKNEILKDFKEKGIDIGNKIDGKIFFDNNNISIENIKIEKGLSKRVIKYFFDSIVGFGSYAFNKSHAASYATITYMTALQKFYYPEVFYKNALMYSSSKSIQQIIHEMVRKNNMKVKLPDINNKVSDFNIDIHEKIITLSLSVLKSVKEETVKILDVVNKELSENNENLKTLMQLFIDIPNIDKSTFVQLGRSGILDKIAILKFNGQDKKLTQQFFDKYGSIFFDAIKKNIDNTIVNVINNNIDKLSKEDNIKDVSKKIKKYIDIRKKILANLSIEKEIEELKEKDKILKENLGDISDYNEMLKIEKEQENLNVQIEKLQNKYKEITDEENKLYNEIKEKYSDILKEIKYYSFSFEDIKKDFNSLLIEFVKKEKKKSKKNEKFNNLTTEEAKSIISYEKEYSDKKLLKIKQEILKDFFIDEKSIKIKIEQNKDIQLQNKLDIETSIQKLSKELFKVNVPEQDTTNPVSLLVISDDLNKYMIPEIDGLEYDGYTIQKLNKSFTDKKTNKLIKYTRYKIGDLEFKKNYNNKLEVDQNYFNRKIKEIKSNSKLNEYAKKSIINKLYELAKKEVYVFHGLDKPEKVLDDNINNIKIENIPLKKENENKYYLNLENKYNIEYKFANNKFILDEKSVLEIKKDINNEIKKLQTSQTKESLKSIEKLNELLNKTNTILKKHKEIGFLVSSKVDKEEFNKKINEIKTLYFDTENDQKLKKEKKSLKSKLKPENIAIILIPKESSKKERKTIYDNIKNIIDKKKMNLVFSIGVDSVKMFKEGNPNYNKISEFNTNYGEYYEIDGFKTAFLENLKWMTMDLNDKNKKLLEQNLRNIYKNIMDNIEIENVYTNNLTSVEKENLNKKFKLK